MVAAVASVTYGAKIDFPTIVGGYPVSMGDRRLRLFVVAFHYYSFRNKKRHAYLRSSFGFPHFVFYTYIKPTFRGKLKQKSERPIQKRMGKRGFCLRGRSFYDRAPNRFKALEGRPNFSGNLIIPQYVDICQLHIV